MVVRHSDYCACVLVGATMVLAMKASAGAPVVRNVKVALNAVGRSSHCQGGCLNLNSGDVPV